ncbi:MAG: YjbF family lipoprotein [Rhizomicrobium sp.]
MTLLSACSSDSGDDWSAMWDVASTSWHARDAPVALEEAAAIPYATLGIRLDGGQEHILVLARDNDGEQLWLSSTKVAITTVNGRVARTSGFDTDLTGYSATEGQRADWTKPHSYSWIGDFADLGYYSVPVTCKDSPAGPDSITILGKAFDTIRVDESCLSEALNWSFTNTYWVGASGRVWRAITHFHPKGPTLETQILRPPLGND